MIAEASRTLGNEDLIDRRVLIVDDDPTVAEVVAEYLRSAGFVVDRVADGFEAIEAEARISPDLIVLDRMLPGIDGIEACRRIRRTSATPIILLTALGSEEERIRGFEAGADDYITKPFSPRELVLRVQSVMRRSLGEFAPESALDRGPFHIDPAARVAMMNGKLLPLTAREFDLLSFLVKHPRQAFSREELLYAVWGWTYGDLSTVTVHVRRLREKIEPDSAQPTLLATVWGVGYRLDIGEDADELADLLQVAALSLAITIVVGGVAFMVLRALRRSSLIVQVCVLIFAAVLAVILSMVGASWLMFLSDHDLTVAINVAVISGTVSLALVACLGIVVVRNARSLSRAARSIGDGERVDAVAPQSSAEFRALADELVATSAKLAQSREREHRIEESRRELVAWIAHDLRTPLAGIMSMAEALEDELAADPQRYHRQMREQVTRLSAMVDDLFELSKIDSGTLRLSLQDVSLYDVISDTVADLRPVSRERDIRVEAGLGRNAVVHADPRELSRAISNLLLNAIQHTPPGSPITVAASVVDGRASVTVIDNGGGIDEQDLHRVFEPGWRGASARTPNAHPEVLGESLRSSGAGLGLAIVRGIAVAHQGEVTVQNVPGGCRFDLILPSAARGREELFA